MLRPLAHVRGSCQPRNCTRAAQIWTAPSTTTGCPEGHVEFGSVSIEFPAAGLKFYAFAYLRKNESALFNSQSEPISVNTKTFVLFLAQFNPLTFLSVL